MTRLERIARRVRRVAEDLEAHEYPSATGPYFALNAWSYRADLSERVDLAHAIYLHGRPALTGSRTFDNCFEMGGADQVVTALARRAEQDRMLHAAIASDFGGTFPAQWRETASRQAELGL